mgnify:CR=1 FL=1
MLERGAELPSEVLGTPDPYKAASKRAWEKLVSKWRESVRAVIGGKAIDSEEGTD